MTSSKDETGAEMPFLDHLEELRWRIIYALASLLIAMALGLFVVLRFDVVGWLAQPMLKLVPNHTLYYTHPSDKLSITINASFIVGSVLSFPALIYQLWAFLAPGLYRKERRLALAVLSGGIFLFVAGAALAFFVVIPLALPWLLDFGSTALTPLITAEDYFGFVFSMMLTFGVSFELPIVILLLAAIGLVTPQLLSKYRRHAIVLIVAAAAFLTPGDMVWTTIALSGPLYGLYELSVLLAHVVARKHAKDSGTSVPVVAMPAT